MIHEIDSRDWAVFCQRVTQQGTGATVKLEVIESDGVKTERVAHADFQSLAFDKTEGCSDLIKLRLKDKREIVHEIIEPIHVKLHSASGPNDYNTVQIEAESGVSYITFHPGIHAKILDGLK